MSAADSIASADVIGIDIGGTKIAAGVVSLPSGRTLAHRVIPTGADRGGRAVLNDVINLARELQLREGALTTGSGHGVKCLGVGICELVDREGRLASANCIQWLNEPAQAELNAIAPAVLEADVRAAALAEGVLGAGKGFGTFLYITIGTGISCCLMQNGEPYLGAHGATGTMASSPLSVVCSECGHVSERTLEEIASGPAIVSAFNARGGKASRGHDVLEAAKTGEHNAVAIIDTAAETLGGQVGLLVNVLDPEAVVVGGGLGLSEGRYWDGLVASTRRHVWSSARHDLPILQAALGADAGWLGAALAAWKRVRELES